MKVRLIKKYPIPYEVGDTFDMDPDVAKYYIRDCIVEEVIEEQEVRMEVRLEPEPLRPFISQEEEGSNE